MLFSLRARGDVSDRHTVNGLRLLNGALKPRNRWCNIGRGIEEKGPHHSSS